MKAIILKEIKSFFGSPIAYLFIGVFLTLNGLFLFVLEGENNVLNGGFADLNNFFEFTPWVLMLLIPAVTMRSFSDEIKLGTIELLLTKPIRIWDIVLGKFLSSTLLSIIALLPTLIYVKVIYNLGFPVGNIDLGVVWGSYFGLLFLVFVFTAIGVFASALSSNQIVAFISTFILCFLFYYGISELGQLLIDTPSNKVSQLGLEYHYKNVNKGIIDTRNVLYFISITLLFLQFTTVKIKSLQW